MSADPGAAAASLHQLPAGVAQCAPALPGYAPRRAAGRARVRQQHPSQRRARADSGPRLAAGASAPRWPPESWKRAQESVALRNGGAMIEAGLMILGCDGEGQPHASHPPSRHHAPARIQRKICIACRSERADTAERASKRTKRPNPILSRARPIEAPRPQSPEERRKHGRVSIMCVCARE
jgi:hypothetical protein